MYTDKVIVALDLPAVETAEALVEAIGDAGTAYKIGYQLLPIGGYDLARRLAGDGKKVFIDAKLLDIGSTVEKGVRSIAPFGAEFLTVHADPGTVRGAAEGRRGTGLKILAVTVLTSWDEEALLAHGITDKVETLVLRRAEMALNAGADGLVASAKEAPVLRARFGTDPIIVTPGIRPAGGALHDQKRVATPKEALRQGADRLVIGRPITAAPDPAAALRQIKDDLADASEGPS